MTFARSKIRVPLNIVYFQSIHTYMIIYARNPLVLIIAPLLRFNSFNPDPILSRIGQELWELDDNRLKPGEDYAIDLQVVSLTRSGACIPRVF